MIIKFKHILKYYKNEIAKKIEKVLQAIICSHDERSKYLSSTEKFESVEHI